MKPEVRSWCYFIVGAIFAILAAGSIWGPNGVYLVGGLMLMALGVMLRILDAIRDSKSPRSAHPAYK